MFDVFGAGKSSKKGIGDKIDVAAKKELTEIERKFRDSAEKYRDKMKDVSDSNFWTCVIFQSAEQAREFNERMGFRPEDCYIDGLKLAAKAGVIIKSPTPAMPQFKIDKSYQKLI